jgi:hypothetical protein
LQLLYQKNPEPTFRDLYNIIIGLRNGTLDLPINSKDWKEKLELFQDLDDTTFVSALSRIEMLATNELLQILRKRSIAGNWPDWDDLEWPDQIDGPWPDWDDEGY